LTAILTGVIGSNTLGHDASCVERKIERGSFSSPEAAGMITQDDFERTLEIASGCRIT
jgi:hypothetical protein